jgi:tryptophanyl-tRNA synthetase
MRILSGLQPSGRLHIGNYFGMMEAALKLQHEGDAYYFIADYHSLTSIHDGKLLREMMAADILIYDSDVVPVGRDQKQHVEVTRDIAIKMNEAFGEGLFKLPVPRIREETAVVPGLDGLKMSKSYDNTIQLFEEPAALKKKIMGIKTDSTPVEEPKPTEGSSILALYKLVAPPADYDTMVADFQRGGMGYGDFKKRLLQAVTDHFAPFRERRLEITADPKYVDRVLAEGAEKARAVARKTLVRVRDAVGLG